MSTSSASIQQLYLAFFNRAADPAGLAFWAGQLDNGLPLEQIASHFAASDEFTAHIPSYQQEMLDKFGSLALIEFEFNTGLTWEPNAFSSIVDALFGGIFPDLTPSESNQIFKDNPDKRMIPYLVLQQADGVILDHIATKVTAAQALTDALAGEDAATVDKALKNSGHWLRRVDNEHPYDPADGTIGALVGSARGDRAPAVIDVFDKWDGLEPQTAGANERVELQVSFTETVTVDTTGGIPVLLIDCGDATCEARYVRGSGGQLLTFEFTLQAGAFNAHADYASANALQLNGGTIRSATGTAANLALPEPGAAHSLADNSELQIDAVKPVVLSTNLEGALATDSNLVLTFSEAIDPLWGHFKLHDSTNGKDGPGLKMRIDGNVVTLDPIGALKPYTSYELRPYNIQDISGNEFGEDPPPSRHWIDSYNRAGLSFQTGAASVSEVRAEDDTLLIDSTAPTTHYFPITQGDGTFDGSLDPGDSFSITFSESVRIASLAADASGFTVSNGHSLGAGATLTASPFAENSYAAGFRITLGANPTVVAGDTLTIAAAKVEDKVGNVAAGDVVFTVPTLITDTIAPRGREWVGVQGDNDDGSYDAGDRIFIYFDEAVKIASLTADASGFTVSSGHSLGAGATLTADLSAENGYATGFWITLGASPTVVSDDKLTIAAAKVEDKVGNVAAGDVVFTVPTLITDTIAPTAHTEYSIDPDVLNYNGSYDAGERIYIRFSEPVKVASLAADASGITVNNGHSLGSGATLTAGYSVGGYASEFWITLGTKPTVVGADTLTFAADKVEDEMGNMAAGDVVLEVPAQIFDVRAPTVSAKTINAMGAVLAVTPEANAVVFLVNNSVTVNTLNDILTAGDANFNSSSGGSISAGLNFLYATGLVDGNYKAYASDLAGNLSDASDNTVTIDNTAPANRGNGLLIQNDSGNSTADAGDALVFEFTETIYFKWEIEAFFTASDSYGGSGTRASVAWSAENTTLTVILGAGESYNVGSSITLTGVKDMARNSADVIFDFT